MEGLGTAAPGIPGVGKGSGLAGSGCPQEAPMEALGTPHPASPWTTLPGSCLASPCSTLQASASDQPFSSGRLSKFSHPGTHGPSWLSDSHPRPQDPQHWELSDHFFQEAVDSFDKVCIRCRPPAHEPRGPSFPSPYCMCLPKAPGFPSPGAHPPVSALFLPHLCTLPGHQTQTPAQSLV